MALMMAAEFASMGAEEMSRFHALSLGKGTKPFRLAPWPTASALHALLLAGAVEAGPAVPFPELPLPPLLLLPVLESVAGESDDCPAGPGQPLQTKMETSKTTRMGQRLMQEDRYITGL